MKSIRLSLIVYFLVLLTGALGAISWFCYATTAESLRARQRDSQAMIEQQCETQVTTVRAELDKRILRQAQTMASMHLAADVVSPRVIGMAASIAGYPKYSHIESADALVANDGDHPQEFFQVYRGNGQVMQRSETMGTIYFSLAKDKEQYALLADEIDEVEPKPGLKMRRVTLKTPVSGYSGTINLWFRPRGPGPGSIPKGPPTMAKGPKTPPGLLAPPASARFDTPTVFIQYASDLGPMEAKIQELEQDRDKKLAQLSGAIEEDLGHLRNQMLWIALASLVALWLGGYLVIRLGLAPLARMSDAVSKISPTNFRLPLETARLPAELQPIAGRLTEVLDQLQKAFAREKQAAADISHELRTPLAALMTNLELGLRKVRSQNEYRDILAECRSSGQHMYQLVERLLTLARLDAGADQFRPTEVDVTELAFQCADLMRPLARARGIELRLDLPDPISMQSDGNKLREILTNLLHNAVEYNKPNGSIALSVTRVNGHLRLEVRDTGIGIKPATLEHIFERFYRADPSRHADTPHAGLGLAIVKSYVDLLGGTIRVESSDTGTAFIVEFPFVEAAPTLETAVQAAPAFAQR